MDGVIQVDEDLRAFLEESGSAVVVGTRNALLAPEITRGWGVRVSPDRRTVELCVGMPSSRRTLDNLADNGQIAVTLVRPSDYRQVQLKGRAIETLSPTAEDRLHMDRQKAFKREVEQVGISPLICAAFWNHDDEDRMVKIRFVPSEAYDQTPGPDAGRPL